MRGRGDTRRRDDETTSSSPFRPVKPGMCDIMRTFRRVHVMLRDSHQDLISLWCLRSKRARTMFLWCRHPTKLRAWHALHTMILLSLHRASEGGCVKTGCLAADGLMVRPEHPAADPRAVVPCGLWRPLALWMHTGNTHLSSRHPQRLHHDPLVTAG